MNRRQILLLTGLSKRSFRSLPAGTGPKTAVEAREEGWIVTGGEFRLNKLKCKLTDAGQAAAKSLKDEPDVDVRPAR